MSLPLGDSNRIKCSDVKVGLTFRIFCIQDFFPGISHRTEQWLAGCLTFLSQVLTFPQENLRLLISGVNVAHPFVFSQIFYDGFEIFMLYLIKVFEKSPAAVGSAAVPVTWGAGQKSLSFPLNNSLWEVSRALFRALSISHCWNLAQRKALLASSLKRDKRGLWGWDVCGVFCFIFWSCEGF